MTQEEREFSLEGFSLPD